MVWLNVCSSSSLVGWLVGWTVCGLFGWVVGGLVDWVVDYLVGWRVG